MRAKAIVLGLTAIALLLGACSNGIPNEYTVLDESLIAEPPTRGDCQLPYRSQVVVIDTTAGSVLDSAEVPWASHILRSETGLVVPHRSVGQPSGVIALDDDLDLQWQSQFPGYLWGGVTPSNGVRQLDDDLLLMWASMYDRATLVAASTRDGASRFELEVPRLRTAPTEIEGNLILSTQSELVAIDSATGETQWRNDIDNDYSGNGLLVADVLVLPARSGHLRGLRADGSLAFEVAAEIDRVGAVVAVAGEIAVVTGTNEPLEFRVAAVDVDAGRALWSQRASESVAPAVGENSVVYALDERGVRAVELATGRTLWEHFEMFEIVEIRRSDRLTLLTIGAPVRERYFAAAVDPEARPQRRWRVELSGRPTFGPFPLGDKVLVGGVIAAFRVQNLDEPDQGWLTALSRETGDTVWTTQLREAPRDAVELSDNLALVTADPVIFCD